MSASTPTTGSYLDFAALTRLKGEASHDPKKALRASAEQFEAYFIQETMKAMRKTVDKSDLMGSSQHTDTYQDLLDKEIAVQMARRGAVGLADMLEREMVRREAGAQPNTQQALALHPANPPLPLNKGASALPLSREAQKAYPIDTSQRSKP
jgi:flagellar protein FlgJ